MKDEDFAELFKQLSSGRSTSTSWREAGADLEALGRTLGDIVRMAWRSQDVDLVLDRLRELLAAARHALDSHHVFTHLSPDRAPDTPLPGMAHAPSMPVA